jgi:transaldolase
MIKKIKISIFADGASLRDIFKLKSNLLIKGFTTNPTLMKKNNITNYKEFALKLLSKIKDKPVSFEVFSDDINEMRIQAYKIAKWGKNVNVKIPITNTKGVKTSNLIGELTSNKILCNVTAIFTTSQVKDVLKKINKKDHIILSVFAGRIADSGKDPEVIMRRCKDLLVRYKNAKLLWASTREIFSIIQAERCGCDIITVPENFIKNLNLIGKDLNQYSLETVKMFYRDAKKVGYNI